MPVVELIRPAELDPRISGPLGGDIGVSRLAVSGGFQYAMDIGDGPVDVVSFYNLLLAMTPGHPIGDGPPEVVDDWLEPDKAEAGNPEAIARILRHEEMLKPDWDDFLPSRRLLIDLVDAVPVTGLGELAVRPITDPEGKTMFAAHYIIGALESTSVTKLFKNAELDEDVSRRLMEILRPYLIPIQPNHETSEQYAQLRFSLFPVVAKELKSSLLDLPETVTDGIIQSTIKPVEEVVRTRQHRLRPHRPDQTVRSLIKPAPFFSARYCVQEVIRDERVIALPYARAGYAASSGSWLIPSSNSFKPTHRSDGSSYLAAEIIEPGVEFGSEYGDVYREYAVDVTTIRPPASAPKVQPRVTWHTNRRTGQREFVLGDDVIESDEGLIVVSGLIGVILAAAVQPQVRAGWPLSMYGKKLGVAQLPVFSLIERDRIATGGLLEKAERLAD